MAAARQKEMKVSITEDATMSRTRLEGGATVVRVEAIVWVPGRLPAIWSQVSSTTAHPAVSLCPNHGRVNGNSKGVEFSRLRRGVGPAHLFRRALCRLQRS